ncbi:hypothetical protein [Kitasatospora griseola]
MDAHQPVQDQTLTRKIGKWLRRNAAVIGSLAAVAGVLVSAIK